VLLDLNNEQWGQKYRISRKVTSTHFCFAVLNRRTVLKSGSSIESSKKRSVRKVFISYCSCQERCVSEVTCCVSVEHCHSLITHLDLLAGPVNWPWRHHVVRPGLNTLTSGQVDTCDALCANRNQLLLYTYTLTCQSLHRYLLSIMTAAQLQL